MLTFPAHLLDGTNFFFFSAEIATDGGLTKHQSTTTASSAKAATPSPSVPSANAPNASKASVGTKERSAQVELVKPPPANEAKSGCGC